MIFPLYMVILYVIVLINLDLFLVHRREMGQRERVTTPSRSHLISEIYFKGIIFAQSNFEVIKLIILRYRLQLLLFMLARFITINFPPSLGLSPYNYVTPYIINYGIKFPNAPLSKVSNLSFRLLTYPQQIWGLKKAWQLIRVGGGEESTYINNIICVYLSPLTVFLALFSPNQLLDGRMLST